MSTLMLKDKPVARLNDVDNVPVGIEEVLDEKRLPVPLLQNRDDKAFRDWFIKRGIPKNREGIKAVIDRVGEAWEKGKNYASLSDQYWIKKRTEEWKKINFFTNMYSPDVGNLFFEPWSFKKKTVDNASPDMTTGGVLKKRWVQDKDKSSNLVKAGSYAARQEPLSETLVATFCERLGAIKCSNYSLAVSGTEICSTCPNFVTQNTELVTAQQFYGMLPRTSDESVYDHILKACDKMEIPNVKDFLDWMIFVDHMTGNGDRHLNNIGFIRDVNTLKFIGPAPLFDSGNAYWSTGKLDMNVRSSMFIDVEDAIVSKLSHQCDIEGILKGNNDGLYMMIEKYPEITDQKKTALINLIKKRNQKLLTHYGIEKAIFVSLSDKEEEAKKKEKELNDNAPVIDAGRGKEKEHATRR